MTESSKNMAIGCVVVASLAILAVILLFLHPSFGDEKVRLHVRFEVIDKINAGTRVTYAGRAVGKVLAIKYLPQEPRKEGNPNDPIYIYDLLLGIDSSVKVYDCDTVSISTSGLMGERYISLLPRYPQGKPARLLANNEIVFAERPISTDETLAKLGATVSHLEQITSGLNASEGLNKLISTATTMCNTINTTAIAFGTSAPKLENAIGKADEIGNETLKTVKALQTLVAQVSSRDGSVGKLLVEDDLYVQANALLSKVDLLMSDINRYGALFHLNKNWQRESKQRLELAMSQADTKPQDK